MICMGLELPDEPEAKPDSAEQRVLLHQMLIEQNTPTGAIIERKLPVLPILPSITWRAYKRIRIDENGRIQSLRKPLRLTGEGKRKARKPKPAPPAEAPPAEASYKPSLADLAIARYLAREPKRAVQGPARTPPPSHREAPGSISGVSDVLGGQKRRTCQPQAFDELDRSALAWLEERGHR